jgi:hypothetical protein
VPGWKGHERRANHGNDFRHDLLDERLFCAVDIVHELKERLDRAVSVRHAPHAQHTKRQEAGMQSADLALDLLIPVVASSI